ncbi:MAG: hypothetical protein CVU97_06935 [Firmicutes bacterium HGW-Firmicutes-21]|nr:MAG: hypothetical protein CVU97_06935 [Firmicutes bacterium HGW-Firmicutes-21]
MNKITFCKTTFDNLENKINLYISTLTGVIEDYWEEHFFNAAAYKIYYDNKTVGFFTLFNNEKITSFWVEHAHICKSQSIFKTILDKFGVKTAYVTTCDELFLSLCLDFHIKIELQAYFFDGTLTQPVRTAEYGRECLIEIEPTEIYAVNKETDNFFEEFTQDSLERGDTIIYRFSYEDETLGYGVIVPVKLMPQNWACGMITLPNYRKKGVGRSIQLHLGDICKENDKTPVSGCWYQNPLSKCTIESAGRYSKTRLLDVYFCD